MESQPPSSMRFLYRFQSICRTVTDGPDRSSFRWLRHFRLGLVDRHFLDALDVVDRLRRDVGRRARHGVETGLRGFHILARHHVDRSDRMLQQTLAGGAKQQTGEAATTTGADHDDVMIVAALVSAPAAGPGTICLLILRFGYASSSGLMRTSRSSWKDAMTPSSSEPFMFGTAEMTSSSAPHESANAAAISNAFRPHLDSSEPTATLVMVLFKCIRLPSSSVYGTTTIGQYAYAAGWSWWCRAVVRPDHPCHGCQ